MGIQERKEREKEQRREEIVDAAQKVFLEKGFASATMDEIAERAELSKGTLYLYYKTKEDLNVAVHIRGMEMLYEEFRKIVDAGGSPPKTLAQLSSAYINFFRRHADYFQVMKFFQSPEFHTHVSAEMHDAGMNANVRIWDLATGVISAGIDAGMIRPGLSPAEIMIIFWSTATSLMYRTDLEEKCWKERMAIDLNETLRKSTALLLEVMFTDKGRNEVRHLLLRS